MNPRDEVFLVTGASSGIGAATARAASAAGAELVLAARRAERVEALAAELGQAVAVPTDVTDAQQVRAAVQAGVDAFGRVDVRVDNAGQGLHAPLEDVDPDDFRAVLELNVVAPPPHTPERVAEAILDLVRSGAPEAVLVPEGFGGPGTP